MKYAHLTVLVLILLRILFFRGTVLLTLFGLKRYELKPRSAGEWGDMKLYHFTAKHLWRKIKKQGLTLGAIPISLYPPEIKPGYIWLTSSDNWDQPSLQGTGALRYGRTEVRIEVEIPEEVKHRLYKFIDHPELTPLFDVLTSKGDPENWYVLQGIVPTGWFRKVSYDRNQAE